MPGTKQPEGERREAILEAAFQVAARTQLRGMRIGDVAREAGVSKGLVFFHFRSKDRLLDSLLEWILEGGPRVEIPPEVAEDDTSHPARRLMRLLRHQVAGLPERRHRVELFLDYWVMGTGSPGTQERIRGAFDRYRAEFLPYTRAVVEALPERFDEDAAEGLAAATVSFIQGCALQMIADPESFDVERYMRAVEGLVLGAPE